ncbi:MAG: bifunctional phosphoribosylaminoimidazolecarboxamide formyltransferase/IMP cyclohydrolase [Propionibacteriaceae bacterium]|jgi:phosphoribosylaminoimidazolecarboxamide formyltransferase/IMP cyclohydrolase|nr:bifunctional phosphoribosylaminoimidazolecarboxamide formyltransferase/IMP cyclohydrolase [Propionibacteriaceae bacterium]
MTDRIPIRRALVSVYDKTGLEDLGRALAQAQVRVVSTGSTAARLRQAGLDVTEVADLTGFPECLGGRVKTLHPVIHAGLLADRRQPSHVEQLADLGVEPFDLVVSNLYPFAQTVASGASLDDCVEQIDIGGPSLMRAAAKNHPSVAIVTAPEQYDGLKTALVLGGYTLAERQTLAKAAFQRSASYDAQVATWMTEVAFPDPTRSKPEWIGQTWRQVTELRYGENAHQAAALYSGPGAGGLARASQLGGKAMSYNNYVDAEAAYRAVGDFTAPAVAIMKHSNPCGIALGDDIAQAHLRAHQCDPLSAYGGVIAANRPVDLALAEQIGPIFTEVIVAPGYEPAALDLLRGKANLRLLEAEPYAKPRFEQRAISGGLLTQDPDLIDAPGDDPARWELKAGQPVDPETLADLAFAWRACRAVKSNAILLAHQRASVGVGMGQVNRVDACRLAVTRAGQRAEGAVAASDAFFPFADGPAILLQAGVRAIVEPGGSIRDQETVEACQAAGVALYFTGTRHFYH